VTLIYCLDILGTFTFAVSGAILAARKKYDLFGALVLGFITAVGGGTIRDLVLGRHVFSFGGGIFWIQDGAYFLAVAAAVLFTLVFLPKMDRFRNLMLVFDAVGIAVFTVIGIGKAEEAGVEPVFAVMMGVVTAVAGGILRDVLAQVRPLVLRKEIYATACIVGGMIYFFLAGLVTHEAQVLITIAAVIGVRLFSVYKGLSLPRFAPRRP
jgi:uncharacterized membrane protein YeiH